MKRALIVTGSGVGAALLALLIAVAFGGPEMGPTPLSTAVCFGWILTLVLSAAAAFFTVGEVGGRTAVASFLMWPLALVLFAAFGDYAAAVLVGLVGAFVAYRFATRTARKWRKARQAAVARIARRKEAARANRKRAVTDATENIPTPWLIDAFDAPESTSRDAMLADLDADTAWALARLHRKGVPAEYVAERWVNGEPLDADALVASYREGGAA